MTQPILNSEEVAELCSGLSQAATQNGNMLTLNIIPKDLAAKLVPGMDLSAEILESTMETPIQKSPPKKEKKFKCVFCGFAFSLSGDLKRHEMTHTGLKQFKCDVCENAFARAATLKIHKMRHSGEKPFPCDICGAAFALNSRLKRHKMSHTGERPFRCDICGHTFIVSRDLKVHKMTHTERENKNYSCDLCGTKFVHKSTMRAHKKTVHIDTTPFKCKICGSAFQVSEELKEHKKIHIGEKIFKCDICGNSFARKLTLRRHELTHSGVKNYHCDICGSSFSRGNTLKIHRMTHTGDKPFKCDICRASFALNVRLKRHMMIHSGERPFKCDVCGAAFALSNRLKRHKSTHFEKKLKNDYYEKTGSVDLNQSAATSLSTSNNSQLSKSQEMVKRSATRKVKGVRSKSKNKLFVCQICGKEFLQEMNFKKHLMGHGLNREKCISSGIEMQGSGSLFNFQVTHKKWLQEKVKKKKFSCNQCKFSTLSNAKFEQHKKIHDRETLSVKRHNYDTRHSSGLSKKISIASGGGTLQENLTKQTSINGDISSVETLNPKNSLEKSNYNCNILTDSQPTLILSENRESKDRNMACEANDKLLTHEATPAETDRVHQCCLCDFVFDSKAEMFSHIQNHTNNNLVTVSKEN